MEFYSKDDLAKYRLERASESLEEARLLAGEEHWNTSLNRLYYACYYSASSYLVAQGIDSNTHTGVKAVFNKALIKTEILPVSFGILYNKLFNLRQDADYRDYRNHTEEEVVPLIEEVAEFVKTIKTLMDM